MTTKQKQHIPYSQIKLKTSKLVNSQFIWNYKTNFKWNGLEFVDFREYNFWDEVKKIDFSKSSQSWKTLIRLYEEERELWVYFLNDFESLCSEKKDILNYLINLVGFWALKSGNKIWLCCSINNKNKFIHARRWNHNFTNILNNINLFLEKKDFEVPLNKGDLGGFFNKNFKLNSDTNKKWSIISYFNNLKIKKNLVFLLTDKLDIDEKQLKILALKNDLIVVNIFSYFENFLDWNWVIWLKKWVKSLFIDLDDKNKKNKYINLRQEKIANFKKKVINFWWGYIYLDKKSNIFKEIYTFFRRR